MLVTRLRQVLLSLFLNRLLAIQLQLNLLLFLRLMHLFLELMHLFVELIFSSVLFLSLQLTLEFILLS